MNSIEIVVGIRTVTSGLIFNTFGIEGCDGVVSMHEVKAPLEYLVAYHGIVTQEWYDKHKRSKSIIIKKIK